MSTHDTLGLSRSAAGVPQHGLICWPRRKLRAGGTNSIRGRIKRNAIVTNTTRADANDKRLFQGLCVGRKFTTTLALCVAVDNQIVHGCVR